MNGDLYICAVLIESVLDILNEILFKTFVIHNCVILSFVAGPDRHPFPVE